uniref:Protein kinase domain-containing protein n=1 Tax=Aureoumbra lagunensis TaxID=44058 RepID=A0A7S3JTP6_9STRA
MSSSNAVVLKPGKMIGSGQFKEVYILADNPHKVILKFKNGAAVFNSIINEEVLNYRKASAEGIGPKYYGFQPLKEGDPDAYRDRSKLDGEQDFVAEMMVEHFDMDLNSPRADEFKSWQLADEVAQKMELFKEKFELIYCDVKSGNILLKADSGEPRIALTDFDPTFMIHIINKPGTRTENSKHMGRIAPLAFVEQSFETLSDAERSFVQAWYSLYAKVLMVTHARINDVIFHEFGIQNGQRFYADLPRFVESIDKYLVGDLKKDTVALSNLKEEARALADLEKSIFTNITNLRSSLTTTNTTSTTTSTSTTNTTATITKSPKPSVAL